MATVIPDVWTLEHSYAAGGVTWTNSIDVSRGDASSTPPADTDIVVTSYSAFLQICLHEGASLTGAKLLKKRGGKGALPIVDTIPIWTKSLTLNGSRLATFGGGGAGDQLTDIQGVAYIKKICLGRPGKMFLRNFLIEGDISAAVGTNWTFTGGTGTVTPATFATEMGALLGDQLTEFTDPTMYHYSVVHIREDTTGAVIDSSVQFVTDIVLEYAGWHRRKRG